MDDGSTDRTKELALQYEKLVQEKGMVFEYHYHENKGVEGTIAEGLKHVKDDYYILLDIDDFLTPDSIRKKSKVS